MSGALVVILVIQFAAKSYTPWVYWLSIVAISTVGTLITDNMHDGLGFANWQMIIGFGLALIATFWVWHKREGSLEMKSINTRKRAAFYWLTILFTLHSEPPVGTSSSIT